jgi:sulfite dehydrogenase (quinone) subunit SoeB
MTSLPASTERSLGLVIDLDTCVGCHACVTSCKEWNSGQYGAPLTDLDAYGAEPEGVFLNRIHAFEAVPEEGAARVVHFPRSCLHCADAPCVTVCPTGASYKRAEDGIVLVERVELHRLRPLRLGLPLRRARDGRGRGRDEEMHALRRPDLQREHREEDRVPACVRACPTGARHFGDLADPGSAVSRLVAERGGFDLMPEQGTRPVNKYLPPRARRTGSPRSRRCSTRSRRAGFLGWLDRTLERLG